MGRNKMVKIIKGVNMIHEVCITVEDIDEKYLPFFTMEGIGVELDSASHLTDTSNYENKQLVFVEEDDQEFILLTEGEVDMDYDFHRSYLVTEEFTPWEDIPNNEQEDIIRILKNLVSMYEKEMKKKLREFEYKLNVAKEFLE